MIDFSTMNLLAIVPHPDDEALMVGGLLQKVKSAHVVVMACGHTRMTELSNSSAVLQFSYGIFSTHDMILSDKTPKCEAIKYLDDVICNFKPDIIVFPKMSHHQDHQYTRDVSIAACRPSVDTSYIKLILEGSYPYDDIYPQSTVNSSYLYISMSKDEVDKKIKALQCHRSQMKDNELDPVHPRVVRDILRMRGIESMTEYAERFEIIRMFV